MVGLVVVSKEAAGKLFERIRPSLNEEDSIQIPVGAHYDGVWIPYGLNEGLKFCKYETGLKL